ncbi:MAG TPA: site-specific integrase [bacterium]|nr:site-specific integrase [bacterium]
MTDEKNAAKRGRKAGSESSGSYEARGGGDGLYKRCDCESWRRCKHSWWITAHVGGVYIRESAHTNNKTIATEILNTRKADALRGAVGIKGESKTRFFDLCSKYLDATRDEKRSHVRDCQSVDTMKAYFGNRRLNDMAGNDLLVRGYIRARMAGEIEASGKQRRPVTRTTVNRDLALLKTMFNKGVEWGLCAGDNPVKRGAIDQRAESEAKRFVFLEPDEVTAYLEAARSIPQYYPVAATAIYTGMRKSEILGLTWDRVDLNNRTIYLERTKGGKRREVKAPEKLTDIFKELESMKSGGHVFINRLNKPYEDIRKSHERALEASGIERRRLGQFDAISDPAERAAAIKRNRITFHTLRHTFGTLLAKECRDLNIVKKAMGHANIVTTERYSHVLPDAHREAVEALSQSLNNTKINTVVDFRGMSSSEARA